MTVRQQRRSVLDLGSVIRRLRRRQGLSVRKLAAAVDFSPSFISQLERNKVSPSIASLERLATGLEVTLGDFFAPQPTGFAVVSRGGRQRLLSGWSRARIEPLGAIRSGQQLQPVMVTIAPGGRSGARNYPHAGERFVLVAEGAIELQIAERAHTMRRGDSVVIPAGVPHSWHNRGRRRTSLVIVSARPQ